MNSSESTNPDLMGCAGFPLPGVFETLLLVKHVSPQDLVKVAALGLHLHLERLANGAAIFELKIDKKEEIIACLKEEIRSFDWNAIDRARARILISRAGLSIQLEAYLEAPVSITLASIAIERSDPHVKSCDTSISQESQRRAALVGAGEGLLIDAEGFVRESSWGNFFWIDHEFRIHTAATGVLKGITREIIIQQLAGKSPVIEDLIEYSRLRTLIRGAFISSSLKGVCEVISIDGVNLADDCKAIINSLKVDYFNLYNSPNPLLSYL